MRSAQLAKYRPFRLGGLRPRRRPEGCSTRSRLYPCLAPLTREWRATCAAEQIDGAHCRIELVVKLRLTRGGVPIRGGLVNITSESARVRRDVSRFEVGSVEAAVASADGEYRHDAKHTAKRGQSSSLNHSSPL